ncbi:hypothetical protein ABJI51_05185 [Amycolatopsis sp. NEAU-NG30]|uniref:Uncharacterized protein n=1 Tax=Amycolatopsis melonis TaxID=3156488 RepID=A0ABV0L862_9PSEU
MNRIETFVNRQFSEKAVEPLQPVPVPALGPVSCLATVVETAAYAVRNTAQVDAYWRAHALFNAAKQVHGVG